MGAVCHKDSHNKHKKNQSPEKESFQPSESDVVQAKLMNMRDELLEKKKSLTISIDKTEAQIKELIRNKKSDSAKYLIKYKKLHEEYLHIVEDKYQFTQKMIIEVQKKIMDKDLMETMKNTNNFLKEIQKTIDVDEMHDLAYNMQKTSEQSKEINELLKKYNADNEEAVDKEYDLIEAQMQMQNIPEPVVNLNSVQDKNQNKEKKPEKKENKANNEDELEERVAALL